MTTRLSPHFTLEEATFSQNASRLGIDNSVHPDELDIIHTLVNTATQLEIVRAILNCPININSWYRCPQLNNNTPGSSKTSQHMTGEAADFICPAFGSPLEICRVIIAHIDLIRFDQLIMEHTWVHISWSSIPQAKQRQEVLSLLSNGHYASGLTDRNGKLYNF